MAKLPPPPPTREVVKNAFRIPTKREFMEKFPSASYSGKSKTWTIQDEEEYHLFLKLEDIWNPVTTGKQRHWTVECPSVAVL